MKRLKTACDVGMAAGARAKQRGVPPEQIWDAGAQHARAFANGRKPATEREWAFLALEYGVGFFSMYDLSPAHPVAKTLAAWRWG